MIEVRYTHPDGSTTAWAPSKFEPTEFEQPDLVEMIMRWDGGEEAHYRRRTEG